jgi:hypothetical protein
MEGEGGIGVGLAAKEEGEEPRGGGDAELVAAS